MYINHLVSSTDNTLSQERLPVIREALPIFTRPSENFEWWKNAVMGYRPQLESSFKSNEVYGILWEMSFTLYGNKSYIPQVCKYIHTIFISNFHSSCMLIIHFGKFFDLILLLLGHFLLSHTTQTYISFHRCLLVYKSQTSQSMIVYTVYLLIFRQGKVQKNNVI